MQHAATTPNVVKVVNLSNLHNRPLERHASYITLLVKPLRHGRSNIFSYSSPSRRNHLMVGDHRIAAGSRRICVDL
jgi:hypothetical protein